MAVHLISVEQSAAWKEGAIALIKSLGGQASPCASLWSPDRYALTTKFGELRIDVTDVFEFWIVYLRFMEGRSPIQVNERGRVCWKMSMDAPMDEALKELEKDLRSWIE